MKVLITGATSGIGRALAELVHKEGHEILGTGRSAEQLERLQSELGAKTLRADLTTVEGQDATVAWIHSEMPDVVVNNAGIGLTGPALSHELNDELNMFRVDALAVLRITLETVKAWRSAGKHGTILNVASALAFSATPQFSNYTAIKAYVNRLSQALDVELQGSGIRVLVSCPGVVSTRFSERAAQAEFDYKKMRRLPVLSPEYVAERMWRQIQTGKGVDTFNWKVVLLTTLLKFAPRKTRAAIWDKAMKQYAEDQGYKS